MPYVIILHIITGTLAVLSGTTTLFTEKGSQTHRAAGNLFFASVLVMSFSGAFVAFKQHSMLAFLASMLSCYLVTTSWLTVKKPENTRIPADFVAAIVGLAVGTFGIFLGLEALDSVDRQGLAFYLFFGALALVAAFLDGVMIFRGGVSGKHRIARHLWRMNFALYVTVSSLFTGPGTQIFPTSWQGNWMLSLPEFAVTLITFVWLARVLFSDWTPKL